MRRSVQAAIFDVDGVLLASPHERAWREALVGLADPARFTTEFYQAHVAGKPRADGALAALAGLWVAEPQAPRASLRRTQAATPGRVHRGGRLHRLRRRGGPGAGAARRRP